jgi:tetratricopeptide (TPR) repeat protein
MKRIACWALPVFLIGAISTQGYAQDEKDFAKKCLMLLNEQKYAEAITECQAALKINPKDAYAWYWIGLAHKATFLELNRTYMDSVNKYNENRTAPQLQTQRAPMNVVEKLASDKLGETLDAFAKAVAIGGDAGTQAQAEIRKLGR